MQMNNCLLSEKTAFAHKFPKTCDKLGQAIEKEPGLLGEFCQSAAGLGVGLQVREAEVEEGRTAPALASVVSRSPGCCP